MLKAPHLNLIRSKQEEMNIPQRMPFFKKKYFDVENLITNRKFNRFS